MQFSFSGLIFAAIVSVASGALAADESLQELRELHRTESLEIPGLTAGCHICEWRPSPNQMPAPEQCGADDSGKGKVGLFECGFSEDCTRTCRFIRCGRL
jgi:hypothetical protein